MTKPIEIRSPRTGKFDYVIIPPPSKLLSQQCHRLRRGQIVWQEIGIQGRVEVLQQWKEAILSDRQLIVDALVNDTGRLSTSFLEINGSLSLSQ